MIDIVAKARALEKRFWWLRGAVAALTIAEFVTKFFDIEPLTWLTGVHLVISAWSSFCEAVGQLIGLLPFIPSLPEIFVSTAFFAIAVALPSVASFFVQAWRASEHARMNPLKRNIVDRVCHPIISSRITVILFSIGVFWVAIESYFQVLAEPKVEVSEEWENRTITLEGVVDENGNPLQFDIRQRVRITTSSRPIGYWFGFFYTACYFIYSLYIFPAMRRGFIYVVGFFVCSELLLAIKSLGISDWICDLATKTMRPENLPSQCAP